MQAVRARGAVVKKIITIVDWLEGAAEPRIIERVVHAGLDETMAPTLAIRHGGWDVRYCGVAQKHCSDLAAMRCDSPVGSRHQLAD
jgi:hypothetical protein